MIFNVFISILLIWFDKSRLHPVYREVERRFALLFEGEYK